MKPGDSQLVAPLEPIGNSEPERPSAFSACAFLQHLGPGLRHDRPFFS